MCRVVDGVYNYKIGAFEALEWVWHMLHSYKNQPKGIEEARVVIMEILLCMGKGDEINFRKKLPMSTISL